MNTATTFADDLLESDSDAEMALELGRGPAPNVGRAELEVWIDWQLSLAAKAEAEIAGNNDVAKRRMQMISDWRDEANAVLQRRLGYIRARIREHTLGFDFGGKRTRKLPSGEFGTRKHPDSIDILDKQKALEFAKAHQVPIKVTEEVQKKPLMEWVQSTGLEPNPEADGFSLNRGSDEFYIKTKGE